MPFIDVRMLPKMDPKTLEDLMVRLQTAVSEIKELKLAPSQVTVAFVPDQLSIGLGEEIIVEMRKIIDKPQRTQEVIQKLAERVKGVILDRLVYHHLSQCKMIEVFAEVFGDPKKNAIAEWHRD